MATVLLTGANGFLGSHLLESLIDSGNKVIVLKRSSSDLWRIKHLLSKATFYDLDTQPLMSAFHDQKIDVVVHLATLYRKFDDVGGIDEMINANFTFPIQLIEAATRNGVRGFINTGSYFEVDCSKSPVLEESKSNAFNLYAKLKTSFNDILKTYSSQIDIVTFRLFSPYGEKDNDKLIPLVIKKALLGEKLDLSEGFQKMDFIYVSDIVNAYLLAIKEMLSENRSLDYQLYNLGCGSAYSVREVVSIVEQNLNLRINVDWGESSKVDIPFVVADINKAKNKFSWEPQFSLQRGINKTIKYYRDALKNGN